jgi:hypothetical protein
MRFPYVVLLSACALMLALPLLAQSPNGVINGLVADPANRVVIGADVVVVNDVTAVQYTTKTNDEGIYVMPNLPPGTYRLQVSKVGFKTLIKPDIVLNVQDALSINFTLPVGAFHETVTVEGGASLVNTESAAASTVVDQKYVANMPLNGRSLQDLILLTPGVTTNSPQSPASFTGEFSVNGQRTESNYYTVDGVSANTGIASVSPATAAISGALPASTALGTTQGLVSVDALEEFRVQSSTYSAEYGRSPGGQFAFSTRSGTNQWHGTGFDYIRNNVFDSNDWFNDYYGVPEPAERQNDFGGTLGGPVEIPGLFHGKGNTFFFFSYEGLRLDQPQAATLTDVPDASLRAKRAITVEDSVTMATLESPADPYAGPPTAYFSLDGKHFVVVVRRANVEGNTNDASVLLYQTADVFDSPKPNVVVKMSSSTSDQYAISGATERFKELCDESVERYQTPHAQRSCHDALAAVAYNCAHSQNNRQRTPYGKPNTSGE